mmetsp:Transcript_19959/g.59711  ORF Transcript_19959/g.59711 Transcript_19959/m.59711 type:complete len:325 (-) Transcript_19959:230-1204(-)
MKGVFPYCPIDEKNWRTFPRASLADVCGSTLPIAYMMYLARSSENFHSSFRYPSTAVSGTSGAAAAASSSGAGASALVQNCRNFIRSRFSLGETERLSRSVCLEHGTSRLPSAMRMKVSLTALNSRYRPMLDEISRSMRAPRERHALGSRSMLYRRYCPSNASSASASSCSGVSSTAGAGSGGPSPFLAAGGAASLVSMVASAAAASSLVWGGAAAGADAGSGGPSPFLAAGGAASLVSMVAFAAAASSLARGGAAAGAGGGGDTAWIASSNPNRRAEWRASTTISSGPSVTATPLSWVASALGLKNWSRERSSLRLKVAHSWP